jgi:2-polyprenyl-3-methyl-5-hydroxy-6-metoxy-1,4-benzoquinol methylase
MTIQCPLCNSANYKIIYGHLKQYPELKIVKCSDCRHIYTFSENNVDESNLYSEGVYKIEGDQKSIFDRILNWEYKKVIKHINRIKPARRSLLDFGCGKGKFASVAQNNGWNVKGVETAKERADHAKKIYGLDVNSDLYSTGKISPSGFDVITLFHVLEHLPAPKILLSELIKNNLNKDGLVVIEVPNFKSLQRKIAGKNWLHLDPSRHVSHFTSTELDKIGEESDLKLVRTGSFSFHLGVLGMTDSFLKLFGYRKNIIPDLKNKKKLLLMAAILFILPFSFLLEALMVTVGKGGIVRMFFIKKGSL